MRKLKLYLDTSVISYLKQDDSPERMADTLAFWKMLEHDVFDMYLSPVVLREVGKCYEPKRNILLKCLDRIDYILVAENKEIVDIAQEIIDLQILKDKSRDDALHIGAAIYSECDYIVSWNFKHLVNIKTVEGIRRLHYFEKNKTINIVTPSYFINMEEKNETDANS